MKFRNLSKFIQKTKTINDSISIIRINGLKQHYVILNYQHVEYIVYRDDRKHGICYDTNSYDKTICCYNRGNLVYKIVYDERSDDIVKYEHYLNNQLHGKIVIRDDYRYAGYSGERYYFINYRYGDQEGYESEYKYSDGELDLRCRFLYEAGVNVRRVL